MIVYTTNSQKDLPINEAQVELIAQQVAAFENRNYDEVSIQFVDTAEICSLHDLYFGDPSPTDCISFPMDEDEEEPDPYRVMGDVIVCPKTALEYADANGCDPYEETTLYLVHGLLHLMGYDDIKALDRKKMRAAEKRHMEQLKKLKLCLC